MVAFAIVVHAAGAAAPSAAALSAAAAAAAGFPVYRHLYKMRQHARPALLRFVPSFPRILSRWTI